MQISKKISEAALSFCALTALSLISVRSFAQDKGLDIDIDVHKKEDDWYRKPWVWVIGGAVFILLLVALLRGRKK